MSHDGAPASGTIPTSRLGGLHDDARRRFEELGADLLKSVVSFREPPRPKHRGFEPDVVKARPLTDAGIVGDLHIGWKGKDGAQTGIAVAEVGGLRTGLVGDGYKALVGLARAMAKVKPFAATASVAFLQEQIFEWIKASRRGTNPPSCVDFVLSALSTAATDQSVLVPVSELYVEAPLVFGPVTIKTFPDAYFQQFEARKLPEGHSPAEHDAWCKSMRSDFQGLAVAEATTYGEPIRARELASENIELVVGIFRFVAPAHLNTRVVSRIARWGYAPPRTDMVFIAQPSGRCAEVKTALIDGDTRTVIDNEMQVVLLEAGLAEVREIVGRDDRTDLEDALLASMTTFGHAALTPDLRERIVWYCAGLESILLKNSSEAILHNLGERMAIFAYDTVDERSAVLKDVAAAYSLRSSFVHHGVDIEDREVIDKFAHHGVKFLLRVAKNISRFGNKEKFLEHIDRMKLSGGIQ